MAKARRYESSQTKERLHLLKLQLCFELKKMIHRKKWSQAQAAFHLQTSRSCIHLVEALKTEKLTVGQLFAYLSELEPSFEILIAIQ